MESIEVQIINPGAVKLLQQLAALNLIVIAKKKKIKSDTKQSDFHSFADYLYPFQPDHIKWKNTGYILREKLVCEISFEEGQYFITNDVLQTNVWGKTREEAEEAFSFVFDSLYEKFGREDDSRLSVKARALKATLLKLIANIIRHNES